MTTLHIIPIYVWYLNSFQWICIDSAVLLVRNFYRFFFCAHFFNLFTEISLDTIGHIGAQLLRSLVYLHSFPSKNSQNGITHADIKPENILLSTVDMSVKLADFGCANYENDFKTSYIQSRFYRAPEALLGGKLGTQIE